MAWDKKKTIELSDKVPKDRLDKSLNISNFDLGQNPVLPLCKCEICEGLIRRPVMFSGCQHAFCLGCTVMKFEGKANEDLKCPKCHICFTPDQVVPCNTRESLLQTLRLVCATCQKKFELREEYEDHKRSCVSDAADGDSMTAKEIMDLSLASPIPKTVEKATLRVLQHMVDNSANGMAEFDSGGPRVRMIFVCLFLFSKSKLYRLYMYL